MSSTSSSTKTITKDMTISTILDSCPKAVEIMLEAGLQCVGCHANLFETLEEGMMGHGFDEKEIDMLVKEINIAFTNKEACKNTPTDADFKVEEITDNNQKKYKIAGILLSDKAYKAIHELANNNKGLQIRIETGRCSGYSYSYDFADKPVQEEKVYKLSDSMKIFMDDFSFDKLCGTEIDFETGLHGSGLVFFNPNTASNCD